MALFKRKGKDLAMAMHAARWNPNWQNLINNVVEYDQFSNAQTVRKDAFVKLLDALKEEQRLSLHIIQDLRDRGLTIGADITDMIVGDENVSTMEPAQCDMNIVRLDVNETAFDQTYVPNPIIHHTTSINWRQNFSDKVSAANRGSMRRVLELMEKNVVLGNSSISVNFNNVNQILYGLLSHPDRETVAVDDWAVTTTNTLANATSMVSAMYNNNKIEGTPGSMILYVPTNSWIPLRGQAFSTKGDLTLEKQILSDHPEIAKIVPLVDLTTGNPVLLYMAPTSVQLAISQEPVVVPHVKTLDLLPQLVTTYGVETPFFHSDVNSKTGIVQGT